MTSESFHVVAAFECQEVPGQHCISLAPGQEIEVLRWNRCGWWWGRRVDDGREGWFPSTFVQPAKIAGILSAASVAGEAGPVKARPPLHPWPSDTVVPDSSFDRIMSSMARPVRVAISFEVLQRAELRLDTAKLNLLAEEVQDGATVILNNAGQLERLVPVAALEVDQSDGRVLVHIGYQDGDRLQATCKLPQKTIVGEESATDTLWSLVSEMLPPVEHCLSVRCSDTQVVDGQWDRSGLSTKHVRTVFHAHLTDQAVIEQMKCRSIGRTRPVSKASSVASWISGEATRGIRGTRTFETSNNRKYFGRENPTERDLCSADVCSIMSDSGKICSRGCTVKSLTC